VVQITEGKARLEASLERMEASLAAARHPSELTKSEGLRSQSEVIRLNREIQELEALHAPAHRSPLNPFQFERHPNSCHFLADKAHRSILLDLERYKASTCCVPRCRGPRGMLP